MLKLSRLSYTYKSPDGDVDALSGITVSIPPGTTAVIGKTGSGKSTLAEIIGGIIEPDSGTAELNGSAVAKVKGKIGLVFQYAEHQLFAETVFEDIAYGLKCRKYPASEINERVRKAAKICGIGSCLHQSPFTLSGGQQRMAAIAGILVLEPELLILDEPTAGLDPCAKRNIFKLLTKLQQKNSSAHIIFITHSMDDAAEYADNVLVLSSGKLAAFGTSERIFSDTAILADCGLEPPHSVQLAAQLKMHGIDIELPLRFDPAADTIAKLCEEGGRYAS